MNNLLAPALALLFVANIASAQVVAHSGDNSLFFKSEKNSTTLVGFKAVFFGGKTYVNWKVKNEHQDDLFVIFRSTDNHQFEIIEIKQGIGTNIEAPIFYSFIDEDPPEATAYYKILKVYADRSFYQSKIVAVSPKTNNLVSDNSFFEWSTER